MDARDPQAIFAMGIKMVVDIAYEEPPARLPRQLGYCRFPINDGGGNDRQWLVPAIRTVVTSLQMQQPVLIACSAGMSRSPMLAAFALSHWLQLEPEKIIETMTAARHPLQLHPQLWADFQQASCRIRKAT